MLGKRLSGGDDNMVRKGNIEANDGEADSEAEEVDMAVGWDQDVAHERWKWRHGHEGMVIHTTTKVWCVNVDCQKGVDLF